MALKVKIIANNGVVTEYHRIASLNIATNQSNSIVVYSYLNEDARNLELESQGKVCTSLADEPTNYPYIETRQIGTDYDENMSVEAAYEYLKTLPEFEGAEDV